MSMLRFLVDKDWKFASAEKKAKSTAAWRIKVRDATHLSLYIYIYILLGLHCVNSDSVPTEA